MKRELYAVFKNGEFKEAAWVSEEGFEDDADRYIRKCEKKYGASDFAYSWGQKAKNYLPKGYEPRVFIPRPSNRNKRKSTFIAKFYNHDADDGVNYE